MLTKWIDDGVQEKVMKMVGLQFEVTTYHQRDIDMDKSKEHNVRPAQEHGYDDEHAARLAVLMGDGADFKRVVVWQPPRQTKALIVHGVHRSGAAFEILKEREISCYRITGPSKELANLVDIYSRIANSYDLSKPPSTEDAYQNAKWLVTRGKSPKEASSLAAIPYETFTSMARQDRTADELREGNFPISGLTRTHLKHLTPIKLTKVRKAVASMLVTRKIPYQDIGPLLKPVLRKGSEAAQLDAVAVLDKQFAKVRPKAPTIMLDVRTRQLFARALASLLNITGIKSEAEILLNVLDVETMRQCRIAGEKLLILGDGKHAKKTRLEKLFNGAIEVEAGSANRLARSRTG